MEIRNEPRPLRVIGLILIAIWFCWYFWSISHIRQWWRHDRLCTNGPYRFVRHPIYAGWILLGCPGFALMLNSWIILLLPVFMYFVYAILIRKEEAMMTAVFGEEYRRYAARTGRFIPRLRSCFGAGYKNL